MTDFDYRNFDYDRSKLQPGWVHLGWGNFARSFVGDIANDVASAGSNKYGLVVIAPSERQEHDLNVLSSQNNIYHLMSRNGREVCQRIGALCDSIIGAKNASRVSDVLMRPETKLVTITVTKDGYCLKGCGGIDYERLNGDLEALRAKDWAKAKTVPGWLIGGLYRRYEAGQEPFIVMSCDNVPFNGKMTTKLLSQLADEVGDPKFSQYVRDRVVCPNTVVDRITPKQNYGEQSQYLAARHIADKCPVVAEEHRELVIENNGRLPPALVQAFKPAKVDFVEDVSPYQDRKLRILNGGHMLFGVAGTILQVKTVRDAVQHPELGTFLHHFCDQIVHALKPQQPSDISDYRHTTLKRFGNPHLTDETSRLLASTGTKIHARFVNTPALEQSLPSSASAFAVATWHRYLQGRDESGNPYNLHDDDHAIVKTRGLNLSDPAFRTNLGTFVAPSGTKVPATAVSTFIDRIVEDIKLIQRDGLKEAIATRFPQPLSYGS